MGRTRDGRTSTPTVLVHTQVKETLDELVRRARGAWRQSKGAGWRKAGPTMALNVAWAAEAGWRRVNAPDVVALVRAGVQFKER